MYIPIITKKRAKPNVLIWVLQHILDTKFSNMIFTADVNYKASNMLDNNYNSWG